MNKFGTAVAVVVACVLAFFLVAGLNLVSAQKVADMTVGQLFGFLVLAYVLFK